MATRFKTVEYCWDNVPTYTTEGTTYTSGDISIYIPETTSRVFKFALLEITSLDNETTVADDINNVNIGLSCNSGTNWTDRNIAVTHADTAENMSHIFTADVTAELVARFSGSSNTTTRYRYSITYASTGQFFGNVSAKLFITYAFDDASVTTAIKTVRIPIESNNTRLSTTATPIGISGGSQIPPLNSYLPESSKVFRDIFFELWTNTAPSGVVDTTLNLSLGSEAEVISGSIENASLSPMLYRRIWKRSDLTTFGSSAHIINARHTTTGSSMFANLGGWLTATYEYDVTTTGSVMNSIIIGAGEEDGYSQTSPNTYERNLWIEEPGPIVTTDCGLFNSFFPGVTSILFSQQIGSNNVHTMLGSYITNGQTGQAGMQNVMYKFGSGWAIPYGSNFSFNRGLTTFVNSWRAATATRFTCYSAIAFINYVSGIGSGGIESHNKTVLYMGSPTLDTSRAAAQRVTWSGSYDIPESNYFINGNIFVIDNHHAGTVGATNLQVQRNSGEGVGSGFEVINTSINATASERLPMRLFGLGRKVFKRYPMDPDTDRLNIETAHTYMWDTTNTSGFGVYNYITYHSGSYLIAGSVGSYAGAGSDIPVYAYRVVNKELIGSTITTGGGAYSIVWYDNVGSVFTEAYESGSRVGRSPNGLAN
jgi:hypothetical protein